MKDSSRSLALPGTIADLPTAIPGIDIIELLIDRGEILFAAGPYGIYRFDSDTFIRPLAELRRILAPGGRLGVMTWAAIEHNPWLATIGMAATVSGVTTGGPPVGPGEIFALADPDRLAELARSAGFSGADVTESEVAFNAADLDTHIDKVVGLAGPLAVRFAAASDEQLDEVRRIVADGAAPFVTDDGYEFPGRALVLTART